MKKTLMSRLMSKLGYVRAPAKFESIVASLSAEVGAGEMPEALKALEQVALAVNAAVEPITRLRTAALGIVDWELAAHDLKLLRREMRELSTRLLATPGTRVLTPASCPRAATECPEKTM